MVADTADQVDDKPLSWLGWIGPIDRMMAVAEHRRIFDRQRREFHGRPTGLVVSRDSRLTFCHGG